MAIFRNHHTVSAFNSVSYGAGIVAVPPADRCSDRCGLYPAIPDGHIGNGKHGPGHAMQWFRLFSDIVESRLTDWSVSFYRKRR